MSVNRFGHHYFEISEQNPVKRAAELCWVAQMKLGHVTGIFTSKALIYVGKRGFCKQALSTPLDFCISVLSDLVYNRDTLKHFKWIDMSMLYLHRILYNVFYSFMSYAIFPHFEKGVNEENLIVFIATFFTVFYLTIF